MEKPTNKAFEDLTGKTFNRLTVMEYAGARYPDRKSKGHQWLCRCECGNEKIILGCSLKSENTMSCGCLHKEHTSAAKFIDITGKIYGLLEVISFDRLEKGSYYWLCKCKCGNEKTINSASLRGGKSKSCGCRRGKFTHGMYGKPGYKKLYLSDPVKKIKHIVSTSIRQALQGKKKGKRTFSHLPYTAEQLKLHLESLFESWMTWDNYGGKNDNPDKTWHIDHIIPHSSFQYTSMDDQAFKDCWALTNLRPLEKIANMAKGNRM